MINSFFFKSLHKHLISYLNVNLKKIKQPSLEYDLIKLFLVTIANCNTVLWPRRRGSPAAARARGEAEHGGPNRRKDARIC